MLQTMEQVLQHPSFQLFITALPRAGRVVNEVTIKYKYNNQS